MSLSDEIPMTPQPWNKNPEGYVYHQTKLKELMVWLETKSLKLAWPEDTGGWDKGVDLFINGQPVDLKGFGVVTHDKTYTWDSTYWTGKSRPIYKGTQTAWFIHPTAGHPSEWIAAHVSNLRTSKYGYAPYYFKDTVVTVGKLVQGLCTRAS